MGRMVGNQEGLERMRFFEVVKAKNKMCRCEVWCRDRKRGGAQGCSQDIADSSDKGQMLTIDEMEVPLFGFTAMESDADSIESASLMLTISTRPRSTSWK